MELSSRSVASAGAVSQRPYFSEPREVSGCPAGTQSPLPPPSKSVKKYRAFLCHAGTEKQTIVSVVLLAIDIFKKSSEVFYDERMRPESTYVDTLERRLMEALCATETLVVFLSWEFLRRKWPMLGRDCGSRVHRSQARCPGDEPAGNHSSN